MKDLPTVEELPVVYLFPTIGMMRHGEDSDLAIDYAYRYLRLHFDQQQAHEAYLQTVLHRADKDTPPYLEAVVPGAAVFCQELSAGEHKWFVLEDTDKPSLDFEEISLDSDLVRELLGKKVGDNFILAPQSIGNREAVIKQIITKYVRRFQQCGADLAVNSGRSAMLQTMQIGPENEVGQPGLVALFNSVQEQARQVALLQSWYAEQPMSLHLYGNRFGHNAYEGLMYVAQTEGMSIKCSDGINASSIRAHCPVSRKTRCERLHDHGAGISYGNFRRWRPYRKGSRVIILDDILKPDDALSETRRKAANDWYFNTLLSRLNSKEHGVILIVMQRLHEEDLVGEVTERELTRSFRKQRRSQPDDTEAG